MQPPKFTLYDVKYADSQAMFARAEELFKKGRVGTVRGVGLGRGYNATVQGSRPYEVWVGARRVDEGDCTCYMGQNDMLCKHMLALALAVLNKTGALVSMPSPVHINEAKSLVSAGMKKIRAYSGPSRTWFSYQRSLSTGAGMMCEAVQALPATEESAEYLWKLVLRLSKKLATGGVDDSDGVVGSCVSEMIAQLGGYAKENPALKPICLMYSKDDTGFGFEDELREVVERVEKKHLKRQ